MTLSRTLAASACALVIVLGANAPASADGLERSEVRTAVSELAQIMEESYVFPDVARTYAQRLRTQLESGAYDSAADRSALASAMQNDLLSVHRDAHLRIGEVREGGAQRGPRPQPRTDLIGQTVWLADGVAYIDINSLNGDEEWARRMADALDRFADAETLILDMRNCPGGGPLMMHEVLDRLFAEPTYVMTMDTRTGASPRMEEAFDSDPHLRRVSGPATVSRFEHWTRPPNPAHSLANARVFVLTGRTASACEHVASALRDTGRATLVGSRTQGAGHYGGDRVFDQGRLRMFLPVGVSYPPSTGQSWESVGVQPHHDVPLAEALRFVLNELRIPAQAAALVESESGD